MIKLKKSKIIALNKKKGQNTQETNNPTGMKVPLREIFSYTVQHEQRS